MKNLMKQALTINEVIGEFTQCPECVREHADVLAPGLADGYVNVDGQLWAICVAHDTRWYTGREAMPALFTTAQPDEAALALLRVVDCVWFPKALFGAAVVDNFEPFIFDFGLPAV
jgi:hypothetical protein